MTQVTVGIIGAGIAGPVLAMFLKQKGFNPIVYERSTNPTSGGLSLVLQVNGLKVLQLIPGLVETLPGQHIKNFSVFSTMTNRPLVLHDLPSKVAQMYKSGSEHGMFGVQREAFHKVLLDAAIARGISIHFGYHLERVKEKKAVDGALPSVEMHFANGESAEASFVVGCDGLHSNTRTELFGEMKPNYTGNVQTGGMSPRPNILSDGTLCNFVGRGSHMVAYPISPTHYSWACTQPEEERKESWRSIDETEKEALKNGYISEWGCGAGELVKTTVKVIKYGLYDRPALTSWFQGRVVLLGDAAHPTTPHLGQGANQAFEDIYHLIRCLQAHEVSPKMIPSTEQLTAAFTDYERVRIPRTSDLVAMARERGKMRTTAANDEKSVRAREERWSKDFGTEGLLAELDPILRGPFDEKSEI